MIVNLPLRLTGDRYEANEEKRVNIIYNNGDILETNIIDDWVLAGGPFIMEKSNGYDNLNNRITNIVGYDGNDLLKRCPKCGSDKPTVYYGSSGRGNRDQSECNECRSQY